MRGIWWTLALIAAPVLAVAQSFEPGSGAVDQGISNLQTVNRQDGDRSVVRQTAGPGSNGNVQTATVSSEGDPPNLAIQRTQGAGSTQSIVIQGGTGNMVVQSTGPGSTGSVQSAVIAGSGHTVQQDSDGDGGTQMVRTSGQGSTAVQTQRGRGNRQTVVQTGSGNVAIQTQRGNGLSGTLRQNGGRADVQEQESVRPE